MGKTIGLQYILLLDLQLEIVHYCQNLNSIITSHSTHLINGYIGHMAKRTIQMTDEDIYDKIVQRLQTCKTVTKIIKF